jgi:hypothetical protein
MKRTYEKPVLMRVAALSKTLAAQNNITPDINAS